MTRPEQVLPGPVMAAVDIGASSGRVMAAGLVDDRIDLVEVHRFDNGPVAREGHLYWDIEMLITEVVAGLRRVVERWPEVISIGVDTWAVDYGLLDASGELIGRPYAYRDPRTEAVIDTVHAAISPERLYAITGLQHLPFNTVYQLTAEQAGPRWPIAARLALLPDLIVHRLTGRLVAEVTNASTTGLLDATSRRWSNEVLDAVGVPGDLLPELVEPGTTVGTVRPGLGLPPIPVVAVGSHDTASAVVGVPAADDHFGYVSSGTWSLVGVELPGPVLTEQSRAANFTNEGGVDRTVRLLRNVGGLWLLEQCREAWGDRAQALGDLLAAAGELPAGGPLVDVDATDLITPGRMPERIADACRRTGQPAPAGPVAITRCILDSLADAYARTLDRAAELSGRPISSVHVVGGGARNELLCRLTARATGREVLAGPVEATAFGNVLVQARTAGLAPDTLPALRRLLADSVQLTRHLP
ncbi:rhamnulokinase [Microlunatus sp. Y2014]|uniref:rhamnulokinase n=1 Tax=Microlunatus sp. Y2014 TaxID=3418488 RepID=UPI003DA776BB